MDDRIERNAFSRRVYHALRRASVDSWRQLEQIPEDRLRTIEGIGAVAFEEIMQVLEARREAAPVSSAVDSANRSEPSGPEHV